MLKLNIEGLKACKNEPLIKSQVIWEGTLVKVEEETRSCGCQV